MARNLGPAHEAARWIHEELGALQKYVFHRDHPSTPKRMLAVPVATSPKACRQSLRAAVPDAINLLMARPVESTRCCQGWLDYAAMVAEKPREGEVCWVFSFGTFVQTS